MSRIYNWDVRRKRAAATSSWEIESKIELDLRQLHEKEAREVAEELL